MLNYFVSIIPTKDNFYFCRIFDFPEAFTQGEDIEDAIEMAEDVLSIWAEEYTSARRTLPKPSTLAQIKELTLKEIAENADDYADSCEPFYQLLRIPSMETKPVRVNVSFPKNVLEQIDKKAAELGMTRSGFLTNSAMAYDGQYNKDDFLS